MLLTLVTRTPVLLKSRSSFLAALRPTKIHITPACLHIQSTRSKNGEEDETKSKGTYSSLALIVASFLIVTANPGFDQ